MSLGGTGRLPLPATRGRDHNQLIAPGCADCRFPPANEERSTGGDAPANLPMEWLVLAGLRQAGTKVGFSQYRTRDCPVGPRPANCINSGNQQPCLYPITTPPPTWVISRRMPMTTNRSSTTAIPTTGSYAGCALANGNQYRT